jgi:cytochrome d ubiquinol oxidase subunit I
MGLIGTRSLDTQMPGIKDLVAHAEERIRNGQHAYAALQALRADRNDAQALSTFQATWRDMGHALLLKRYRDDIGNATDDQIAKAALDTVPNVLPLFWTFRIMVALGLYFIGFFAVAFWYVTTHRIEQKRGFLKLALWSLLLPWVAIEAGWIIAEYGRQPWIIDGVLPTFFAASGLKLYEVVLSLCGFTALYTTLAVVEIWLLRKLIRKGPTDYVGAQSKPAASALATSPTV